MNNSKTKPHWTAQRCPGSYTDVPRRGYVQCPICDRTCYAKWSRRGFFVPLHKSRVAELAHDRASEMIRGALPSEEEIARELFCAEQGEVFREGRIPERYVNHAKAVLTLVASRLNKDQGAIPTKELGAAIETAIGAELWGHVPEWPDAGAVAKRLRPKVLRAILAFFTAGPDNAEAHARAKVDTEPNVLDT